ncbi:hypothetical protein IT414_02410 [bacterium]|nr:hypothetical protein [bacterium]
MAKLCPALLVPDLTAYREALAVVRQLTNRFQLDVIDGEFVDNRTVQPDDIQPLPGEIKLDIHLMVNDPVAYAEKVIRLKPSLTIFQFETPGDLSSAIARVRKSNLKVGIALNPKTEISVLDEYAEQIAHVLIMAYPAGFAGQEFDKKVLHRIDAVRDKFPNVEIGIDGGITADTVELVMQHDIDVVNVNSYLFGSSDPLSRYSELMGKML